MIIETNNSNILKIKAIIVLENKYQMISFNVY